MKLLEYHDILNSDLFVRSPALQQAWHEIQQAIALTDWPHGSGSFTIYPESGKKTGQGNGVKPIKIPCIQALRDSGWLVEGLPSIGPVSWVRVIWTRLKKPRRGISPLNGRRAISPPAIEP